MTQEQDTKLCPHCGTPNHLPPIVTTCRKCLKPLADALPPLVTPPPVPQQPADEPPAPPPVIAQVPRPADAAPVAAPPTIHRSMTSRAGS